MKHLFFFALLTLPIAIYAQTRKEMIGCWTMSGMKNENLSLDSEGNFFFNDYQEYTRSFEPIYGTWKLRGNTLILSYDEQKQIKFKIKQTEDGAWMLARSGKVRLFKAKPEDCEPAVPER